MSDEKYNIDKHLVNNYIQKAQLFSDSQKITDKQNNTREQDVYEIPKNESNNKEENQSDNKLIENEEQNIQTINIGYDSLNEFSITIENKESKTEDKKYFNIEYLKNVSYLELFRELLYNNLQENKDINLLPYYYHEQEKDNVSITKWINDCFMDTNTTWKITNEIYLKIKRDFDRIINIINHNNQDKHVRIAISEPNKIKYIKTNNLIKPKIEIYFYNENYYKFRDIIKNDLGYDRNPEYHEFKIIHDIIDKFIKFLNVNKSYDYNKSKDYVEMVKNMDNIDFKKICSCENYHKLKNILQHDYFIQCEFYVNRCNYDEKETHNNMDYNKCCLYGKQGLMFIMGILGMVTITIGIIEFKSSTDVKSHLTRLYWYFTTITILTIIKKCWRKLYLERIGWKFAKDGDIISIFNPNKSIKPWYWFILHFIALCVFEPNILIYPDKFILTYPKCCIMLCLKN